MPKPTFAFSLSVQLILTNLPTVRRIQQLFDEGTIKEEVTQFLKHLEVRLREHIPRTSTWQSEISDGSLYLYPGQSWHVVKDDHMAVCFYMEQCITPCFYNSEDDPMVALYVPKWQHRRDFIKRLREFRLPTFEHIGDHAEIEEENYYPLWSTVHLAPHVNHSRLDLDGIEKTILNRVKRLIAVEGKISDLILEVRHKRG